MIGTCVWPWPSRRHIEVHAGRNLACRMQAHRTYGWGTVDAYLRLAREMDVFCLPILKWEKARPTNDAEWGEWLGYVSEAVKMFPWKVYWQVWNEPNNPSVPEWNFPDPKSYQHFMEVTARHMKGINPNVKIVAGGIACGKHGGKRPPVDFNWDWFTQDRIVDRVAVHTYSSTIDGAVTAIRGAQGMAPQPVWCTELGRKASVDGEEKQAAWFKGVHAKTPKVPKFWFNFKAGEDAPTFDSFSAIRADWSRRPVFWKLAEAAKA
jgi:hypothetical protein